MRAALIFLFAAFAGCAAAVTHLPETMSHRKKMETGGRLYARKCSACHPLKDPASLPGAEWEQAVGKYGKKAGLISAERELVRYFLTRSAADAPEQPVSGETID